MYTLVHWLIGALGQTAGCLWEPLDASWPCLPSGAHGISLVTFSIPMAMFLKHLFCLVRNLQHYVHTVEIAAVSWNLTPGSHGISTLMPRLQISF